MPLTTSTALVRAEGLDHNFGDVDSADRGRQGMKALPRVKAPPTAVVATSDMYAIGARTAVHDEGITPALGPAAADAVRSGAERAREAGRLVSFDVNYRSRLWPAERARSTLRPLASAASIVFGSEPELALLTSNQRDGAEAVAEELLELGVLAVVVKRGVQGATAYTADGATSVPARVVRPVDLVGAGDAFVSGYLSGVLDGIGTADRLRRGAAVSAFAVGSTGDWEGLPTRQELSLLDAAEETIR